MRFFFQACDVARTLLVRFLLNNLQVLCKIYSILSDTNKRAIYDEDGTVDEEDDPMFNEVKWDNSKFWCQLLETHKVILHSIVCIGP